MYHAIECIKKVAAKTDQIILFHSATGKDSIAMLNLCAPYFKKIVCVFMYIVKDLEHEYKYLVWANRKYPNVEFIQVPHYVLSQYYRDGVLGCAKMPEQNVYQLNHIEKMVKTNTKIDWCIKGFKQSDSMNRGLQLRTYEDESIYEPTHSAYPLSRYKNKDVEKYIKKNKLITPVQYGKGQSQGADVNSIAFLKYCKDFFPNDYAKIIKEFPQCEMIVFNFENQ